MAVKIEFPPIPKNLGQGTGSSTKKSSTKKSSGSSGSSAQTPTKAAESQYIQALISTYLSIWGMKPPPGYIERIARSGMNTFELQSHEASKPGYRLSPHYLEQQVQTRHFLAQQLGNPV